MFSLNSDMIWAYISATAVYTGNFNYVRSLR